MSLHRCSKKSEDKVRDFDLCKLNKWSCPFTLCSSAVLLPLKWLITILAYILIIICSINLHLCLKKNPVGQQLRTSSPAASDWALTTDTVISPHRVSFQLCTRLCFHCAHPLKSPPIQAWIQRIQKAPHPNLFRCCNLSTWWMDIFHVENENRKITLTFRWRTWGKILWEFIQTGTYANAGSFSILQWHYNNSQMKRHMTKNIKINL